MGKIEEYAFDKIKRTVARNTLLMYPYFNKAFKIYTDDSALKLGEVISHKVKPIALYSRKLTDSEQWYIVT